MSAKPPNQSTVNGILHASTHPFPNDDLSNYGEKNGWPSRLFGPARSQALIEAGITTFRQLVREVRSRTKAEFYRDFGTCDGKVGPLDTAANTMWEVVTVWAQAQEPRDAPRGADTTTDAWLTFADTHQIPAEDLKLGQSGGWPPGAMGPQRVAKLKEMGITCTSQLMHEALTKSYDRFMADFGGRDAALDVRAGAFYGFLHRVYAANA
jgi:hypothetical protein